MTKVITSTELNRNAGAMLKLVEEGEAIHITRNGKVVAILTRAETIAPVTPDITKPVVEKKATLDPNAMTPEEELDNFDDWGLPIDPGLAPRSVSYDHDVKAVGTNPPETVVRSGPKPPNPEPLKPWKAPMGLSKSQQAGGKYER